jgi:NADH dehydrogenase
MPGLVTVFGGSGFIGSQIVRDLARRGYRVRVAVRKPGRAYRLPLLGDVGQIEVTQANLLNQASVDRALEGAEACVNCVSVLHETGRQTFEGLNVAGASAIAWSARRRGVERLVHLSAIGADASSPSAYARTKAQGEEAVREAMPMATILRPSIVFGPEDAFFNRFAQMAETSPILPLVGGGKTRFQPVFVGDVAQAAGVAVSEARARGRTYELGGPGVYSFKELLQFLLRTTGQARILAPLPFWMAGLIGRGGDLIARTGLMAPPLTRDQVTLLKKDNVVSPGALTLRDLGITPSALEPIAPTYLYRFRRGGQYAGARDAEAQSSPALS